MSFTSNAGYTMADIKLTSISGRPGLGVCRISLGCEFTFPASISPGTRIQELRCDVYIRGSTNNEILLGAAFPESSPNLDTKKIAYQTQVFFCFDLDPRRIEAIEELRKGGDLTFRLILTGIAQPPTSSSEQPSLVHEWGLSLLVNQRAWMDALTAAGHGRFLLFEIPFPPSGVRKELAEAIDHLERAKHHFDLGHYDEAVARCRRALESLTAGLCDAEEVAKTKSDYFSSREIREDMPIKSRILFLREAIKHVAHLAAHGEALGNQEHYNRHDARLMLSATAATLAYASYR